MKSPIEFLRDEATELQGVADSLRRGVSESAHPESYGFLLKAAADHATLAREYRVAIDKLERD